MATKKAGKARKMKLWFTRFYGTPYIVMAPSLKGVRQALVDMDATGNVKEHNLDWGDWSAIEISYPTKAVAKLDAIAVINRGRRVKPLDQETLRLIPVRQTT